MEEESAAQLKIVVREANLSRKPLIQLENESPLPIEFKNTKKSTEANIF